MWRTLLLSGWKDATLSTKNHEIKRLRVLCGGESLSSDLAERLLATGAEIWNMYGPTETTIWSLAHRVERRPPVEQTAVAVGRPIANTQAFVMDAQRRLLPVGIPGILFLGGVGLARGYRGQPEQTAERFMKVDSVGGLRLYDTGDLAVQRADGTRFAATASNSKQLKLPFCAIPGSQLQLFVHGRNPQGICGSARTLFPRIL
jgi:non-ribosomal peptide synthetase component F